MTRILAVVIAIFCILGFGVAHGVWTNRWNLSTAPQEAAAKLQGVPRTIGDWEGTDLEVNPKAVKVSEATGFVNRHYVNRRTGVTITVMLLCGPPGPISVHPPEVCYVGAGFTFVIDPGKCTVPNDALPAPAEFFHTRLTKPTVPGSPQQRLLWAWTPDGKWIAADNPRLAFARAPALYKLYVQRTLTRFDEQLADDPIQGFLQAFLPELQKALFAVP
jgi:hypothetical protein